jgi:3-oxoacyl-[acyl-carrier protein] reductase
MKLEGEVVFVTGAGSGLGAEICRLFAAEGARVMATDIDEASAAAVAAQCAESTAGATSAHCNVADSKSVSGAFAALDAAFGRVDILVNNAGIVHSDPDHAARFNATAQAQVAEALAGGPIRTHWEAVENLTDEKFDRMIKVHLYGTFYCTREALPRMRAAGQGGRVINMGSIMGTASLAGAPDYCAAKGGILAFTRAVAREAASYDVLVNAIAPGFIDTPLLDPTGDPLKALVAAQTPLGRLGQASEIAAAALFLAGPDSTFVTGQTLSPNGGIYMSQ